MIEIKTQLRGLYKLVVRDAATMEITRETDWFDNLILDNGTNRMSQGNIADVCVVGTGNTVPVVTQTSLVSIVGSTTSAVEGTTAMHAGPPWYVACRRRFRFAAGAAAGNLSEVGVGWATNQLWSRALIVDGGGSPTTITVLSTEVLDVWYELRSYMEETDVNFQLQIGPVLHDCVLRPADIDTAWTDHNLIFQGWVGAVLGCSVYSGPIGPITGQPSGTAAGIGGVLQAYINNSRQRNVMHTFTLDQANFVGGIDAALYSGYIGRFQVGFTPPIDKTNTKQLTLTFRWAWARFTP